MAERISVSDAVERYLEYREREGATANTLRNHGTQLRKFARIIEGRRGMQIRNLTGEHVYDYFYGPTGIMSEHSDARGRVYKPISLSTHNLVRQYLKSFFDWCRRRSYIKGNPMEEIKSKRVPQKQRQQPAPQTLLALLDVAECPRDRVWIAACINTGCRQSELRDRKIKHLDLQANRFSLQIYKSNKEHEFPITADFAAELRRWLVAYQEDLGRPLDPEDYLFPHRVGGMFASRTVEGLDGPFKVPYRTSWELRPDKMIPETQKIVQKALDRLGLLTRFEGTHTLRRGAARAAFEKASADKNYDGALRVAMAFLHHSNSQTTEHYLGLDVDRKKLDDLLLDQPFLTAMVDQGNVVPLKAAQ